MTDTAIIHPTRECSAHPDTLAGKPAHCERDVWEVRVCRWCKIPMDVYPFTVYGPPHAGNPSTVFGKPQVSLIASELLNAREVLADLEAVKRAVAALETTVRRACPVGARIRYRTTEGVVSETIKQCPFCGSDAYHQKTDDDGGAVIKCGWCHASTAVHYDSRENLESSWNERHKGTAYQELIGRAVENFDAWWESERTHWRKEDRNFAWYVWRLAAPREAEVESLRQLVKSRERKIGELEKMLQQPVSAEGGRRGNERKQK